LHRYHNRRPCQEIIDHLAISRFCPKYRFLAKVFNFEISGLPDRFLMEMEENVNPGMGKGQFSKIPFENRTNMQSQIVAYDSRTHNSTPIS